MMSVVGILEIVSNRLEEKEIPGHLSLEGLCM